MAGRVEMFAALTDAIADLKTARRGAAPLEDAWVVLAVGLALLLVALFWARFLRKPAREDINPDRVLREAEPSRRRRAGGASASRREHRPRFPTLAEKGGLPPVRDEQPSPGNITNAS
ncbi:MAG: hypothetical protein AB1705_09820 [Verrucomicrobiota bacterium]